MARPQWVNKAVKNLFTNTCKDWHINNFLLARLSSFPFQKVNLQLSRKTFEKIYLIDLQCTCQGFSGDGICRVLTCVQGGGSVKRWHLTSIGNPIVEIRRSYDCLISTMGFPILVRLHLYIESGPWCSLTSKMIQSHVNNRGTWRRRSLKNQIDDLVQNCSNCIANQGVLKSRTIASATRRTKCIYI